MEQQKLEITAFELEELKIDRNASYEVSDSFGPVNVSVDFEVFTNRDDATQFAVGLIVKTCCSDEPDVRCPLKILARIAGYFVVSEPLAEGKVPVPIAVNGLTILYGIARGHLATATGWFGVPVVFPTVYFSERVRAKLQPMPEVNEIETTAATAD